MILKPAQYCDKRALTGCGLHGYSLASVPFLTGRPNIAAVVVK